MDKQIKISKKICMLGTFGVGKTSLVRRFVYDKFDEKYLSTIGVQISQKQLPPMKNSSAGRTERLNLILWDLAQIEKFNNVIKNYFRGSQGAIIVFDVTRLKTFKETDVLLKSYLEMNPKSKLVFVGNKTDLVKSSELDLEQFLRLSESYQTSYFLTSAKTGKNVGQLFTHIGKLLLEAD